MNWPPSAGNPKHETTVSANILRIILNNLTLSNDFPDFLKGDHFTLCIHPIKGAFSVDDLPLAIFLIFSREVFFIAFWAGHWGSGLAIQHLSLYETPFSPWLR
jgi:hypothetical protein